MAVKNVVFIADKVFYGNDNIQMLEKQKLHYIIPMRRNNKLIDFSLLGKNDFKKHIKTYFVDQNRIVWHYE